MRYKKQKGYSMIKRIKLAIIAVLTLAIAVGCGSDDSSSGYQTSDNMRERFSYLNNGFISTQNSTIACIQAGTGDSYTIHTSFVHDEDPFVSGFTTQSTLTLTTEAYRKSGCAGEPEQIVTQEYLLFIGEEINQGTRLEIDVLLTKFDFAFQDIRTFSEAIVFGSDITVGEFYYTVIVGQGGLQTDTLKYGFANADENHNGITEEFRANDVSKYTSGNTFMLQI